MSRYVDLSFTTAMDLETELARALGAYPRRPKRLKLEIVHGKGYLYVDRETPLFNGFVLRGSCTMDLAKKYLKSKGFKSCR